MNETKIEIMPICEDGKLVGYWFLVALDPDFFAEVMTGQVLMVGPDMEAGVAAHLMGRQQVRRLPVVENGKLCGDVDFDAVSQKASFITPVPGGVGPMTICSLMKNTLLARKGELFNF